MNIFGVKIRPILEKNVLKLNFKKQLFLITLNPEILLKAYYSANFKQILNYSTFHTIDGIGLQLIARFLYKKKLKRATGSDLFIKLLNKINIENNHKIFLYGASENNLNKALNRIRYNYPNIIINGIHGNIPKKEAVKMINQKKPEILLITLGAPKQEVFLYNYLFKMPSVKLAIGIGGGIDSFAYPYLRGPLFMRKIGLEWFWRLLVQPWRMPRIFRATIIFPIKAIIEKFKNK